MPNNGRKNKVPNQYRPGTTKYCLEIAKNDENSKIRCSRGIVSDGPAPIK